MTQVDTSSLRLAWHVLARYDCLLSPTVGMESPPAGQPASQPAFEGAAAAVSVVSVVLDRGGGGALSCVHGEAVSSSKKGMVWPSRGWCELTAPPCANGGGGERIYCAARLVIVIVIEGDGGGGR